MSHVKGPVPLFGRLPRRYAVDGGASKAGKNVDFFFGQSCRKTAGHQQVPVAVQ